jgi:hypothetical protein
MFRSKALPQRGNEARGQLHGDAVAFAG